MRGVSSIFVLAVSCRAALARRGMITAATIIARRLRQRVLAVSKFLRLEVCLRSYYGTLICAHELLCLGANQWSNSLLPPDVAPCSRIQVLYRFRSESIHGLPQILLQIKRFLKHTFHQLL